MVVEVLRVLAEMIVYGDSKSELLFDHFCEKNMLALFLEIVSAQQCPSAVHLQLLQTLSILINCVKNDTSLYYLLSNNYVNDIITVYASLTLGPDGEGMVERTSTKDKDDSVLQYFASFLKSTSLRMNKQTIQFFFNAETRRFPLLAAAIQLLRSGDNMVRISAQSIVLNVYRVEDEAVYSFTLSDAFAGAIVANIAATLAEQLEAVSSGGDSGEGAEARVAEELNLIEDWLLYAVDLMGLGVEPLRQRLLQGLVASFFMPRVLEPLERIAGGPAGAITDGNTKLNALLMYLVTFSRAVTDRKLFSLVLSPLLQPAVASSSGHAGKYRSAIVTLLHSSSCSASRLVCLLLYNVAEHALAAAGADALETATLLTQLRVCPCDGATDAGSSELTVIEDVIDALVSTSVDGRDSCSRDSCDWLVSELLRAPLASLSAPCVQARVYTAYAFARLAYQQRGLCGDAAVGRQLSRWLAEAAEAARTVQQSLLQRIASAPTAAGSSEASGGARESAAFKTAEFAVLCAHEEIHRLQGQTGWYGVSRSMMRVSPAQLQHQSTLQTPRLTSPDRTPLCCCRCELRLWLVRS